MLIAEEKEKRKEARKLTNRREHLTLSVEERRRQLSEQADQLVSHYEKTTDERKVWQGGDVIDL